MRAEHQANRLITSKMWNFPFGCPPPCRLQLLLKVSLSLIKGLHKLFCAFSVKHGLFTKDAILSFEAGVIESGCWPWRLKFMIAKWKSSWLCPWWYYLPSVLRSSQDILILILCTSFGVVVIIIIIIIIISFQNFWGYNDLQWIPQ